MSDRRAFLAGCALASVAAAVPSTARAGEAGLGAYDVRAFGARGDGKTNDTTAVQEAIDQCSQTGGTLVFPPGEYRTGMIRLKSRVTIELQNQAVWRAIPDVSLYPVVVAGLPPAFIFAEDEEDFHITGQGKIHGSGDAHEAFIPWREQTKGPRPFGLLLRRCRNISLTGITLENSAYWMLRPTDCDDVVIRGVKIRNLANFNNDGIDVVDCHRVVISDCVLDCEDDAICLKTYSGRGVEDVVISNCVLSSHARVIKISLPAVPGSRFNRIAVSNCIIKPSEAKTTLHPRQLVGGISGIDLATSSHGAAVTNVSFNNIVIDGVATPIFIRLGNQPSGAHPPVTGAASPGIVENVTLANIRAVNSGAVACSISGHPGCYVKNVRLANISLALNESGTAADISTEVPEKSGVTPTPLVFGVNLPAYGLYLRHVKDVSIDGLHLRPQADEPRPELVADDVHGLQVSQLTSSLPEREIPRLKISNSTRVRIRGEHETL